jgi:hypothetical protein
MRGLSLVAAVLGAWGGPAGAAMYDAAELAAERPRLEGRIAELQGLVTLPEHVPPDAGWLAGVEVALPDLGRGGDPLGFESDGSRVVMPLAGLRFIEDLTMAYAWRYRAGRTLEPFDEYLAMLRWRPEGDWPGGQYLDPLEAFGVPPAVWESEPEVGALGTSLRNEAWAFILAHELAHLYYRHPGNRAVPPAESQANEREADAFALEVLDRAATIPMGAILYFQATAAFYPSRADAPTDEAYAQWQREEATHPVNSRRLRALAEDLAGAAGRQSDPARAEALDYIARGLGTIAADLDDPAMQQLIVRRAIYGNPADLKER